MRYLVLICSIVLVSYSVIAQQDTSVRVLFRHVIGVLASDSMKGRATGSTEITLALSFLQDEFKKRTHHRLKTQPFVIQQDSTSTLATNAYYFLNNHAPSTIIIGAHYDHIGLGGPLSKSFQNNAIHNGADDNASGVAMTLALAETLCRQKKSSVNYLFVFYSGHEIGLFGSTSFFQEVLTKHRRFRTIEHVFNFDMVGRMDPNRHTVLCATFPSGDSILTRLTNNYGIQLRETGSEVLQKLDTKMYVEAGIPSVNITTGIHPDYHKISDDACYIHYDGMQQIYELLRDLFLHYIPSSDTQKEGV